MCLHDVWEGEKKSKWLSGQPHILTLYKIFYRPDGILRSPMVYRKWQWGNNEAERRGLIMVGNIGSSSLTYPCGFHSYYEYGDAELHCEAFKLIVEEKELEEKELYVYRAYAPKESVLAVGLGLIGTINKNKKLVLDTKGISVVTSKLYVMPTDQVVYPSTLN